MCSAAPFQKVFRHCIAWFPYFRFLLILFLHIVVGQPLINQFLFNKLLEIFTAACQRSLLHILNNLTPPSPLNSALINLIFLGSSERHIIKIESFWCIGNVYTLVFFYCIQIEVISLYWFDVVWFYGDLVEGRISLLGLGFRLGLTLLFFWILGWDEFRQRICWLFLHISWFGSHHRFLLLILLLSPIANRFLINFLHILFLRLIPVLTLLPKTLRSADT